MTHKPLSRRRMMQLAGGATAAVPFSQAWGLGMPQEGPDTPKLTMYMENLLDPAEARRLKQIGITSIDAGTTPAQPWGMDYLQPRVEFLKSQGMKIGIMMVRWSFQNGMDPDMNQIVHGTPQRDAEIDKIRQTIVNFGRLGIPVLEWNWYNHRATEGYSNTLGRGDSGMSTFNYEKMKDLAPLPAEGTQDYDTTWRNMEYFLKAVVPVAEKNNVVLSLHPNDPPPPTSRGSAQVMNSLSDWKRLIETVDSPSNCLTWDCGVTREIGEDPIAVGNYFASRNRIGQVHFRNVNMRTPRLDYTEVWPDEGDNDMYEVMKLLVQNRYTRMIMPEHPRGNDADRALGRNWGEYVGWTYDVAYARAMLQIALRQVRGL